MKLPIETQRLILRKFKKADLHAFVAYRKHPDVARLQTWDESYSLKEAKAFLDYQDKTQPDQPDTWLQLALEHKQTGELLGDIAVHTLEDIRQVEIGYTLAPENWGNGYMTEALEKMLEVFFGEMHKHRLTATTDPRNASSISLLKRLGFRQEAHFVKSMWFKGEWVDDVVFALLRDEWLKR